MKVSNSSETAMPPTVSVLRSRLRKALLATKPVRVIKAPLPFYDESPDAAHNAGFVELRSAGWGTAPARTLGEGPAQFAAEDLARRRARDGIDEMNFARLLVVGEAV